MANSGYLSLRCSLPESMEDDLPQMLEGWPVLGSSDCLGAVEFDIVMCNIISTDMLPVLPQPPGLLAPDGVAVLSGLLAIETNDITEALSPLRLEVRGERTLGEWASLVVAVPGR